MPLVTGLVGVAGVGILDHVTDANQVSVVVGRGELAQAVSLCAATVTACDDNQVVSDAKDGDATAAAPREPADTPTVDCSDAILDRVDPEWRKRSIVRGRFGLYGDSSDLRTADRWGRDAFWTKIPVIVDGHRAATLRVLPRDRRRVGLTYGPSSSSPATSTDGAGGLSVAPRELRFVPCQDRAPTAWPGGLALSDRKTVSFRVRLAGRPWSSLSIHGRP